MEKVNEIDCLPLISEINEEKQEIPQINDKGNNLDDTKNVKRLEKLEEYVASESDGEPPAKKQKTVQGSKSPKKRLNLPQNEGKDKLYIYGNYSRYYGYRNLKDFRDVRLDIFAVNKDLFEGKEILDIGCNCGLLTMEIAKNMKIKQITGIDIDKSLINKAVKYVHKVKRSFTGDNKAGFPFNISFVHGNYVLIDDVLLEIEREQFDVILCLSVTKWIHLNFGDNGLKRAFRRMFAQLRPGGKLILEAQPWQGYKRRKKLTPEIFDNYKSIKFFPKDFTNYLLGPEVGFSELHDLGIPSHCSEGFRRPIHVFTKQNQIKTEDATISTSISK